MADTELYFLRWNMMYDMKTGEIIAVFDGATWVKEIGLNARMDKIANVGIQKENDAVSRQAEKDLQAIRAQQAPATPPAPAVAIPPAEPEQSPDANADPPTPEQSPASQTAELDPAKIPFEDFLDSNEKAVSSSNLESVNYDASRQILRIMFRRGNGYYYYGDVSYTEYQGLLTADSIGRYFHLRIKPKPLFHR